MLNWLGRLLKLPEAFLNKPGSPGGGVIQVYHIRAIYTIDLKLIIVMLGILKTVTVG